ncbi:MULTISPECIES: SDR family oxidoreductase [unclassified Rhodococcus (in: high G+C Gram-positive bacteria)]|uniref:SDR family oxidoreductase n=1 Tax=unclassified Rhodococcus (in: high G+C Gram-positive bacteria) TaxID=192944 RepID=UPI001C65901B|nr:MULTISPECIES: SDR family NAD(P)-dependent oxidoreductase [unclassified Rhodococcus (in: high G+C Gram-positive bacteria)]
MAPLTGTIAIVTGASSGIGRATAQRLAVEGATVAVVARRADRLVVLVDDIRKAGGTAFAVETDITDRNQAEKAVQTVVDTYGRLDILVNNAGLMILGPFAEANVDDFERMIDVNQKGLLYLTKAALSHLTEAVSDSPRGVADIVNISSIAGREAWGNFGAYAMTKFGVNGFTEALRQEITQRHVRVGVIEPGAVDTELQSHNTAEVQEKYAAFPADKQPLGPEDIADAVAYMTTRPAHASISEMWVMPTDQV